MFQFTQLSLKEGKKSEYYRLDPKIILLDFSLFVITWKSWALHSLLIEANLDIPANYWERLQYPTLGLKICITLTTIFGKAIERNEDVPVLQLLFS